MSNILNTKYGKIIYTLSDNKITVNTPLELSGKRLNEIKKTHKEEIEQIKLNLYDKSRNSST